MKQPCPQYTGLVPKILFLLCSSFEQWLNRDELFLSELVSVTNNIQLQKQVTDTAPIDIPKTVTQVENSAFLGWKRLKLKLRQGFDRSDLAKFVLAQD